MEENLIPHYLPKAGEVCETRHKDGRVWYTTEIKYIDKDCIVYQIDGKAPSIHKSLEYLTFRKIKTEEEKFVETYVSLLRLTYPNASPDVSDVTYRWISTLYRQGFRYVGDEK